tara:strand:+ start:4632 stop:5939 length:1308 start_codon:yes stop_codon:yes gene_type:complete
MNKKIKIFNKFIIFVLIIPSIFIFDSLNAKTKDTESMLQLFEDILKKTKKHYVEEITEEELIEKAINGMLSGLDPHSGYMDEETYKEMQIDTSGKFGGLGIQITMEEGFVKVISPIDDTPAFEAGVKAGDFITQIDGSPVVGMTLSEAVELMRGKPGSDITITIAREGLELFDITITRAIIKIQSVKYEIYNDVGYLRISSFTEEAEDELVNAINKIKEELNDKLLGYVIDLRSNPGGLLHMAVGVSDIFLERGNIVSTRERDDRNTRVYRAKPGDLTNKKPLVVLINEGSASASEIVAGALQDHNRAIILGTNSFGKGSVQSIIPLYDHKENKFGAMRLTTARYYTPSGRSIQAKGITPDLIIKQGKFEFNEYDIISESDLIGSLDSEKKLNLPNDENSSADYKNNKEIDILRQDYQLSRAVDLISALSVLKVN